MEITPDDIHAAINGLFYVYLTVLFAVGWVAGSIR